MSRAGLPALLVLVVACTPARAPVSAQPTAVDAETAPPGSDHAGVALTTGDGTRLRLASFEARSVLYGPLASTELHLRFAPPATRSEAASLSVALPRGASVARSGSGWRESEVLEKHADGVEGANVFHARVDRIDTGAEKEIVLAYTETLAERDVPYRVLVGGLPQLDRLAVEVRVPGRKQVAVLHRTHEAPRNDVVVRPAADAVRGGNFAIARVEAPGADAPSSLEGVAVLIDSSASQSKSYGDDVERAARIVEELGIVPIAIAAFDQEIAPLTSIRAAKTRRAAGGTDLAAALAWAESKQAKRAIVVTDGLPTMGALQGSTLERVDVIAASGMTPGVAPLRELAAGARNAGAVVEARDTDGARAIASDGTTIRSAVVAGAVHTWPSDLARDGTTAASVLAFAELPASAPLRVGVNGGFARDVARIDEAPPALVERAVADARMRELERTRRHGDGIPAPRVDVTVCGITVIPRVLFAAGSAALTTDTAKVVDEVAQTLKLHPEYVAVAVFGNTDEREPNAQDLSTRRANAVRDALVKGGVDPKVLYAKGLAARYSDAPATDEGRARNRRVDFRILVTTDGPTGVELSDQVPEIASHHGKFPPRSPPYEGEYAAVMALLAKKDASGALARANEWTRRDPHDLLAWLALGRALDATGDAPEAARAYGSIFELAPTAAHLRAMGGFLESLAPRYPRALDLAVEAYRRAFADRPDQLASHRQLAWALAQQGHVPNALQILEAGMTHFSARLQTDVDLLSGKGPPTAILSWESEGDDLDLVAYDAQEKPTFALPDARNGFGPETLAFSPSARLEVQYQTRGSSGYPIGKVMIVTPGPKLTVETRPFVLMNPFSRLAP